MMILMVDLENLVMIIADRAFDIKKTGTRRTNSRGDGGM